MINMDDTLEMMISDDYKERFKAEYYQLTIRFYKLKRMLEKWDKGELNFTPTCPRELYDRQIISMANYMIVLKERAAIENIRIYCKECFDRD